MAEISKSRESKFSWVSEKDISFEKDISIPDNLQEIVDNAPAEDVELARYLQGLLIEDKITLDEVNFLIDSKVFENRS